MNLLDELNYHIWAEHQFFDEIENCSPEQWISNENLLNKSLQRLFACKVEVIWFWFYTAKQEALPEELEFDSMDKDSLQSYLFSLLDEVKEFIKQNESKRLELKISWIKGLYTVSSYELIYNFLNHLTYHRGQLAILLRHLGFSVDDADYNPYMYQKLNLELKE